jgi:hypothetical protein
VAPAAGCKKDPEVTVRTVTMHLPCTPGGLTLDGNGQAFYQGLGDFDPSTVPIAAHPAASKGDPLPELNPSARALVIDATENDRDWWGIGNLPSQGSVDILMFPATTSCALAASVPGDDASNDVDGGANQAAATLGAYGDGSRVLVVGGTGAVPGEALSTQVVHLDTGAVVIAQPDLRTPRLGATITPFGTGALVAGGYDPRTAGIPLQDAEVFDDSVGGFDQAAPIMLSEPRAAQGATTLTTGETLLVGGIGGPSGTTLLDTMEIVDPVSRAVRAEDVALLAVARRAPVVIRLASGEVLVAGGVDASGNAVATLEWFRADASAPSRAVRDLVTGSAVAYIALEAGGALAVIAPPSPAPSNFQSVWVIDADGTLEAATPIEGSLTHPLLFGGAGGAPVLWTGDRWLVWEPWLGAFGALTVLDASPAIVTDAAASPDPGLAMWIDGASGALVGLRFDTRGPYSSLIAPLLVVDAANMAPDRLAASQADDFDPSSGLALAMGASAFVTDRTYADVLVEVDTPQPTLVVLRDVYGNELEVGGQACPEPLLQQPASLEVKRSGAVVQWTLPGGQSGQCPSGVLAGARVSVGLRGIGSAGSESVARNLRVTRIATP